MSSQRFKFKQFTIHQERCAMKIGTDSVLLGAWAALDKNPFSILDIGAGTGVLALMLAQRSSAQVIDALEIDPDAYEQCLENFENSDWGDRVFCYHASLLEFAEEIDDKYDLIICNPPFYSEDYKTENKARDLARFNDAMPFEHLVYSAAKLLSEAGSFNVIIPFKEEDYFIRLCSEVGLYNSKILHVKGHKDSEIKRSLLEFSFEKAETTISELIIENGRHNYTEAYIDLTSDFYLKL